MGKLYEVNWYQKWQKKKIWAISRSCTGIGTGLYRYRYRDVPVHPHQKPTYIDTGPTFTGTPQQNATCTGIGQRCTDTGVSKMPRMCSFCVIKPKFIHR